MHIFRPTRREDRIRYLYEGINYDYDTRVVVLMTPLVSISQSRFAGRRLLEIGL